MYKLWPEASLDTRGRSNGKWVQAEKRDFDSISNDLAVDCLYIFLPFLDLFLFFSQAVFSVNVRMLSKRLIHTARLVRLSQARQPWRHASLPLAFQHVRNYADKVIKVPQMAESISEGTLKQWSKQVGDYVELDEEIATIETDKVRTLALPSMSSLTRLTVMFGRLMLP